MEFNSQLICALQMTLSEDKNNRSQAENFFESIESNNNYFINLINISLDQNFPRDLRLTASIMVKNHVKKYWANGENVNIDKIVDKLEKGQVKNIVIPAGEKEYLQNNVFNIILSSNDNHIIKMYLNIIKRILKCNFAKWENEFMQNVENWLKSNDQTKILYALKIFSKLAKEYEFSDEEEDIYLRNFERIIAILEGFLENIISLSEVNETLLSIVNSILKIYQCTIRVSLPPILKNEQKLVKWFGYFTFFINKIENLPYDETSKLWRNIILSFKITSFIYSEFGKTTSNKKKIELSSLIKNKISNPLSNVYIKVLYLSSNQEISNEILCIIYNFLNISLKRKENIEVILNSFNFIFDNLLIKHCRITEEDLDLRVSNPKYYIYNRFNSEELMNDTRFCIGEFVKALMKHHINQSQTLYNNVMEILYNSLKNADQLNDCLCKEAILYLMEFNYHEISKNSEDFINELIASFIFKDMDSESGLLRERACSFLSVIDPNKIKSLDILKSAVDKFIPRLEDPEFPVKIQAALAIPQLIIREEVKSYFQKYISNILSIYLKLIEVIELDRLIICLEQIVSNFDSDIIDFCYDLMIRMVSSYLNLIKVESEDDETAEAEVAASCCLRAIRKLLSLSSRNPYLFEKVERCVEPILSLFFCTDREQSLLDDMEPIITLINDIIVLSNTISKFSWSLYTPLIFSLTGTEEEIKYILTTNDNYYYYQKIGYEYIDKICSILMNYIIRDPHTFVTSNDQYNQSYVNRTMTFIEQLVKISSSKKTEFEACNGIKIISVMLESLEGKIDFLYDKLVIFLIEQLKVSRTDYYKIKIVGALSNCFIYNPIITLKILDSLNVTANIFEVWIYFLQKIYNMNDIKRFMMGLTSILSTVYHESSPFIKNNITNILSEIIVLLKKLLDLDEKRQNTNKLREDDPEDSEDEVDINYNFIEVNYNEDDEDDEDYEDNSNEILSTVQDSKCGFKYFSDFLNYIYQKDLNLYNQLMSSLNSDQNRIIQMTISKVKNA